MRLNAVSAVRPCIQKGELDVCGPDGGHPQQHLIHQHTDIETGVKRSREEMREGS